MSVWRTGIDQRICDIDTPHLIVRHSSSVCIHQVAEIPDRRVGCHFSHRKLLHDLSLHMQRQSDCVELNLWHREHYACLPQWSHSNGQRAVNLNQQSS